MAKTTKTPAQTPENTPPPSIFGVPQTDMTPEQILSALDEDEFDIFVDVGDAFTKAGDRITYTIKRDGEFLAGSIKHPFSWDQVQAKYGGGTYQVTARSTKKGGYIKTESRNVAPPAETPAEHRDENMKPPTNSTTDLLLLLQNMKKEEREEAREREDRIEQQRREDQQRKDQEAKERVEEMKNSSNQTMTMMMQMMKSQSEQTNALLTALMGGKKEEMGIEKILALVEKVSGKKGAGEMTVAEQIRIAADAEERGRKSTLEMLRMADKRAEEIADMRERGGTSKEEGSSAIERVIEAVTPLAQGFMAAKMGAAPSAPSIPGVNPHTKALPPPPGPLSMKPRAPNTAQMLGLNRTPGERKAPVMTQKDVIEKIVVDEIGKDLSANMLTMKFDPEGAADKALAILSTHKITPVVLCSQYSLDDMLKGAKARGLPEQVTPYLERFYAHIKGKADANTKDEATVGLGTAPESSKQPTA